MIEKIGNWIFPLKSGFGRTLFDTHQAMRLCLTKRALVIELNSNNNTKKQSLVAMHKYLPYKGARD